MRMMWSLRSFAIVLAFAPAVAALADEGKIPLFAGGTISAPGHYILTRDVAGVFSITSDNVVLDLNGGTVTLPPAPICITIDPTAQNVTIKNGTLSGGSNGINYLNTTAGSTDNYNLAIEDLVLLQWSGSGIFLNDTSASALPSSARIRRCYFSRGTGGGTAIVGSSSASESFLIEGCVIQNVGLDGISVILDGAIVRGNSVTAFGTGAAGRSGILVGVNALVEENTVEGGADDIGILAGAGSLVFRNTVRSNGGDGIDMNGNGGVASGNVVTLNGGDGIQTGAGTNNILVEGNQIQGNTGCGINFGGSASSHAYSDNMLRGNTGGTTCGVAATDAGGNIL